VDNKRVNWIHSAVKKQISYWKIRSKSLVTCALLVTTNLRLGCGSIKIPGWRRDDVNPQTDDPKKELFVAGS
jgi:hypothetical protein